MEQSFRISSCLLISSIAGMLPVFGQAKKAPNILFIMSDDHAVRAVGCYGSGLNKTPNIDALAADGVRFTNACVGNSVSGPCRATLLTGKHSNMNGFKTNSDIFDSTQQTFPRILQQAGYATAIVGKWHLKSNPVGFDYWDILPDQGDYYNPDFIEMGRKTQEKGYVTEIITQKSLEWIKSMKGSDKSFCLLVHHKAPHRNWLPAPRHFNDYKGVTFPLPPTFFDDYSTRSKSTANQSMRIAKDLTPSYDLKLTREDAPDSLIIDGMQPLNSRMDQNTWQQWLSAYREDNQDFYNKKPQGKDLAIWKYQRYMHDYLATINSVDESVGEIIRYLKENGLYENTIIVYTSDQGFYTGEHGWYDKRFMYEESLHTPLIIHTPSTTGKKKVCDALVQNIDFAPSLLDFAGLEVPADMQGISLLQLIDNPKLQPRKAVYYHYYEYPGVHTVRRHLGIRTEQYKLIHFYYDLDEWELYDLKADPYELKNLYADKAYQQVVADLKKQLVQLQLQYKVPSIETELKSGNLK